MWIIAGNWKIVIFSGGIVSGGILSGGILSGGILSCYREIGVISNVSLVRDQNHGHNWRDY